MIALLTNTNVRSIFAYMKKSAQTKNNILDTAFRVASNSSLNDLTIGSLSAALDMSKSGLFAHFNSKENLQLAVLEYAEDRYTEQVINPTMEIADPLERLKAIAALWLDWYESLEAGNCIFITALVELDDQEGRVHELVKAQLGRLISYLIHRVQVCIDHQQINANTDPEQFVFEWYSLYTGSQLTRLMGLETNDRKRFKQSFDALLQRHLA